MHLVVFYVFCCVNVEIRWCVSSCALTTSLPLSLERCGVPCGRRDSKVHFLGGNCGRMWVGAHRTFNTTAVGIVACYALFVVLSRCHDASCYNVCLSPYFILECSYVMCLCDDTDTALCRVTCCWLVLLWLSNCCWRAAVEEVVDFEEYMADADHPHGRLFAFNSAALTSDTLMFQNHPEVGDEVYVWRLRLVRWLSVRVGNDRWWRGRQTCLSVCTII